MKAFVYYSEVPELYAPQTQLDLISLWKKSWSKQGWETVVLSKDDVKNAPGFAGHLEKIWSLPTVFGHKYEEACFLRWLAVANAGGGMLCDYDVMNYGFTPPEEVSGMTLICADSPQCIDMGAVLGTGESFKEMFDIYMGWTPDPSLDFDAAARPPQMHCGDMNLMVRIFEQENFPKPSWLTRRPGCVRFSCAGWETAPMVHYGYEMKAAGYWPKCDHVEKLRSF